MIATERLISTPTVELPASRAASLRRWNIGLGLVHAVQAVAVLGLATAFALPVTATLNIFALNMWLQYRRVESVEVVRLRREGLLHAQPGREVGARLAGVRGDTGGLIPSDASGHLSLHEAADLLGVHYMTIYRRVRLGILPARKIGGTWMVDPADLERATTTPDRGRRRRGGSHPRVSIWQERLQARMLSGDVAGSWQVIEAAMASGLEPGEIYVRVLAPSLHAIGALWQSGGISVDQEHLASSVATTLIGRLGPRFVHPGRKKGVVIVAMPPGERHGLGVAMLADILTDAGYGVLNLGPDTPNASLAAAMRDAGPLAAVVVSVVDIERRPAAGRLLAAARRERPSVPRLVGGNAVPDERVALDLGADGWVADPRGLGDLIEALRARA